MPLDGASALLIVTVEHKHTESGWLNSYSSYWPLSFLFFLVVSPRVDTKSSNRRCRAGHPGVREEGVPDQLCFSKANDRDFEAQLRALGGRQAAEAAAPGVTVAEGKRRRLEANS